MDTINTANSSAAPRAPRSPLPAPRRAFTLVELLVVITIIAILAALITVAAVGAMRSAQRTRIKAELDQISAGIEEYRNQNASYPPNVQTDNTGPLNEMQVFNELKRHINQAFPRNREPDGLLRQIAGLNAPTGSPLPGGMTAGEALVFWLSGFSDDPRYPISGEGGPSYPAANELNDPVESRNWIFPFAVERLEPRDANGYFGSNRSIQFAHPQTGELRRINFWQYVPANSEQPYLYFDTSRHAPTAALDPPAATALAAGLELHVYAIKIFNQSQSAGQLPIRYANEGKFQILHCGIDNDWGVEAFRRMSVHRLQEDGLDPAIADDYLLFPDGPFTGAIADTLTNFTEGTLEDAQP